MTKLCRIRMPVLRRTMSAQRVDCTKNEDVFRQILDQLDTSVGSFAALLRLRSTCTTAKGIIDGMLHPVSKEIPGWLRMLRARTSAITHSKVLLDLNGGAGTQDDPPIHWKLKYITRADVFRTFQENYFFDERVVGIILDCMHTRVGDIILAVRDAITHNFHEAVCLFGDVCIRAMRCHIKNRDIVLHGCSILADMQSHAGRDCEFIGRQLPMLTDALYHHRTNLETVSALLRFTYRVDKKHRVSKLNGISSCGVHKCDKFSEALADAMQYHTHSSAWLNIQGAVALHYTRKACVNMSCEILGQIWKIEHGEYYASVGFAKSVAALANAARVHEGRTSLKSGDNAVRLLLRGRSVGCTEILSAVKHMLRASGLMNPSKNKKRRRHLGF